MNYTEFTGKTVEEAVEKGLKELGITAEQADIRVLEEGKKKLFKSVSARVEIAVKAEEFGAACECECGCQESACECGETCDCEAAAEQPSVSVSDSGATDGERTVVFLNGLFELLDIDAQTELVAEGEKVEINVTAEHSTSVIGKHGAMLDAIQTLAGAVANTGREDYKRVVVDCENYRRNREDTLNKLSENLSQKAIRLGKKIQLEPMNPYERRIMHAAISEIEGVSTISEGKEPNRYIVIVPNNLEDPDAPALPARNNRDNRGGRDRNRGYGRGGRGGRDDRGNHGARGGRGGYNKKPYNRGGKPSGTTGGTSLKNSNDFFGIFLGNSGNGEDKE